MQRLRRLFNDQRGASAVEYGLICALIIVVMFVALNKVAMATISKWNTVSNQSLAVM